MGEKQKQAAKRGNFGNAGTDRKPIRALRMKSSQQRRSWRFRRKMFPVFEVKKEIPDHIYLSCRRSEMQTRFPTGGLLALLAAITLLGCGGGSFAPPPP
jgi:hypothetical protein